MTSEELASIDGWPGRIMGDFETTRFARCNPSKMLSCLELKHGEVLMEWEITLPTIGAR
jgi:hypothetical protein